MKVLRGGKEEMFWGCPLCVLCLAGGITSLEQIGHQQVSGGTVGSGLREINTNVICHHLMLCDLMQITQLLWASFSIDLFNIHQHVFIEHSPTIYYARHLDTVVNREVSCPYASDDVVGEIDKKKR